MVGSWNGREGAIKAKDPRLLGAGPSPFYFLLPVYQVGQGESAKFVLGSICPGIQGIEILRKPDPIDKVFHRTRAGWLSWLGKTCFVSCQFSVLSSQLSGFWFWCGGRDAEVQAIY